MQKERIEFLLVSADGAIGKNEMNKSHTGLRNNNDFPL